MPHVFRPTIQTETTKNRSLNTELEAEIAKDLNEKVLKIPEVTINGRKD
jgi:hypothetical protein